MEKGGERVLDELVMSLRCHGQVQQIYYTAGETDLVVIVVARTMAEYDELSRRLFMANDNIRKFTSKVVIRTHKAGLTVPLYRVE
nr:Lrp/AsnC ligand binding domain-containing protein [Bowmanella dokdonensis]